MTNDGSPRQPQADSPDWDALARFSAGESGPEEAAAVRRWLDANPQDAAAVAVLDSASKRLAFVPAPDLDVEAALRRVTARMHEPVVRPIERPKVPVAALPTRSRWPATALIGLAAAAGIATVLVVTRTGPAPDPGVSVTPPTPPAARSFSTGVGGRDSVMLADGSRVILGPASRLTVPADFGTTSRTVEFNGVAYFDVVHDAAKPFSVRDGRAVINDLGTRFSVQDDADGTVHVAVTEGSVELRAVGAATQGVTLKVGDRGTLDPTGKAQAARGAVNDDDLAWMRGKLVFRDSPMPHVATMLERWYGVQLRPDSMLAHRTITTPTAAGESARHVVDVIAITLGARVEQRGDTFFLHTARPRIAPP